MKLSVFDITKGISWTEEGHFYLSYNDSKFELLIEYLNSLTVQNIRFEIERLEQFGIVHASNDKKKIEEFIMMELEGFFKNDDGLFAHIAGAHDLSPSIRYDIQNDILFFKHPNIKSIEKLVITVKSLLLILNQYMNIIDAISKTPET
jgi:hypothetical protein